MKLIISEEERQEILGRYKDNIDDKLLNYLKRNFNIYSQELEWLDKPIKFINIHGKTKSLNQNKSYLVNKLASEVSEEFPKLDEKIIRRTIKLFIDINRV
jgi:hypothetical protein